ncbi:MAG: hypothetical protein HC902_14070 [Calothrix sp. SM1_5_4]|nr:hypothetical protein [Calothrix sp. SM1_5_4]
MPLFAFATPSPWPDWQEYVSTCRLHRSMDRSASLKAPPPIGEITYLPLGTFEAGQPRFSFLRLLTALDNALVSDSGPRLDPHARKWIFAHDRGRSAYGPNKPAKGVFYRGRVYIVDGHHGVLVSTYLGAKTIPTTVLADWSSRYEPDEFRNAMERHGLAYWRDAYGQPIPPPDLCEMNRRREPATRAAADPPRIHLLLRGRPGYNEVAGGGRLCRGQNQHRHTLL